MQWRGPRDSSGQRPAARLVGLLACVCLLGTAAAGALPPKYPSIGRFPYSDTASLSGVSLLQSGPIRGLKHRVLRRPSPLGWPQCCAPSDMHRMRQGFELPDLLHPTKPALLVLLPVLHV